MCPAGACRGTVGELNCVVDGIVPHKILPVGWCFGNKLPIKAAKVLLVTLLSDIFSLIKVGIENSLLHFGLIISAHVVIS